MTTPEPESSHVRRVLLPSGKEIDVVYFSPSGVERPVAADPPGPRGCAPIDEVDDLHLCGACGSGLVHPVEWEPAGKERWLVSLRCPNCEWSGSGVFCQEAVDRFDEELERGSEVLLGDLEQMTRANMAEQLERFIAALDADALLPSDF